MILLRLASVYETKKSTVKTHKHPARFRGFRGKYSRNNYEAHHNPMFSAFQKVHVKSNITNRGTGETSMLFTVYKTPVTI